MLSRESGKEKQEERNLLSLKFKLIRQDFMVSHAKHQKSCYLDFIYQMKKIYIVNYSNLTLFTDLSKNAYIEDKERKKK